MLPVLDNEAMREADRHTIEDLGIPGLELMENAAAGVVDALRDSYPEARRILILCGRGNNGGDGLAAARLLVSGGLEIKVLLFADPENLSPDATENFRQAKTAGVPIVEIEGDDLSPLDTELESHPPDLIVDALLGTGTTGQVREPYAELIEGVNRLGLPVLAVDVPSGLDCDTGMPLGAAVRAARTVTFVAAKRGFAEPASRQYTGEVKVADISVPRKLLEEKCALWQAEES